MTEDIKKQIKKRNILLAIDFSMIFILVIVSIYFMDKSNQLLSEENKLIAMFSILAVLIVILSTARRNNKIRNKLISKIK